MQGAVPAFVSKLHLTLVYAESRAQPHARHRFRMSLAQRRLVGVESRQVAAPVRLAGSEADGRDAEKPESESESEFVY